MNKLKLFISVGICGILFTGCGFFDSLFGTTSSSSKSNSKVVSSNSDSSSSASNSKMASAQKEQEQSCTPADLKERLLSYKSGGVSYDTYYDESFKENNKKCNQWLIDSYNEAIKKAKSLPTTFEEEEKFANEWYYCDAMPEWLNIKLKGYIEQNKDNDVEYIRASKFRETWQGRLSGKSSLVINTKMFVSRSLADTDEHIIADCFASKKAREAIENDLIDLDNGKKAKCANLSYKDSRKCLNRFDSVYNKVYKATKQELKIKKERELYEQKNKQ